MAIPRKPKSPVAATPSKVSKPVIAASKAPKSRAPKAAEPMIAAALPAAFPQSMDVLVHETAEKVVLEARDVQDNIRCATEETMVQTRAAYDRLKHAAEEVSDTLETSFVKVTRGFGELNQKAMEGLKAQAEANFEHFKALAAAKSIPEAISLQTDHARKQIETLSAQMKEFTTLAQKVVTEATEPLKTTFDKSLAA